MDLLRGNIKTLYFKYLSAAFGSALISSIYGIVDMAMVGQYQGPDGTAALAVVAPVWNVIYSIGLLMGIGGSVIFSTKRGSGMSADGEDEQYFTAAVIGSVILAALAWVGLILFERPLLMFFGTDETLLALAQRYMIPVKFVFPLFLFNQMLAAFLRNDGAPALVTLGVLSGGVWPESELSDTSWDGIPPALSSPSCIVTAVPSISVISPVIVWPEQSDVLLPHAASDSVSAAAQKRERIFLLFIKNGLLRHCVSQMLPRGCRFSLSPWNEVMIARQPKKAKGKFEHFVFHENAKSSAA